ncbi:MAG TPA: Xaa-Pro peptidase family protein [Caulobacteraceae bacterium]|jgi:Xaa-Pro dipeptidase|nr:Xaa-Pro peptidase family protein [Caulobacteraceae bacterium]
MGLSRREMFAAAGGGLALTATGAGAAAAAPGPGTGLTSITTGATPIGRPERLERLAKLRRLMKSAGVTALIVESGSSLDYFTGVQWRRSERTTAAVIPVDGEVVIVTPDFEAPSVKETLAVPGQVRVWEEHESPFAVIANVLKTRRAGAGPVAAEDTTRLFIVEGVRQAAGVRVVSGGGLVRDCRMIKTPAELALMQTANDVTIAALRHVRGKVQTGMTSADIAAIMDAASLDLGASQVEFSLVLLNEASAFPHGSRQPQSVREGSVILMDCGCSLHGYQSDISRTFIHGEPSKRQREVWDLVRKGQALALETARPGMPCGLVDDAVRALYVKHGYGPGYKLPGLSHRTGHGIGMDGHEAPYLVHGDATALKPGMCFSDEPGIYIPGEFGVRLEDCWHMTQSGPKLFTGLAASIDDPI